MKSLPRLLMFVAALSLLGLFAFPMWSITLYAPQYPDGVTMYIWINKLSGSTEGTLQNINILNHYVGMKMIEPESIPELKYFPYVIYAMVALGLLVALINKKNLFLVWTILLVVLCTAGIYDFYLWEYDYGHNLSADAPISIPGMAYQPPLIGRKALLNFIADSWPHIGGAFVGVSMLAGFLAWWLRRRETQQV
ncbi:MAG: hypothetical protein IPN33_14740 [Saprospiraceae bacterium]|nr:hypothetical protein [Saprospiraceae bacterium]